MFSGSAALAVDFSCTEHYMAKTQMFSVYPKCQLFCYPTLAVVIQKEKKKNTVCLQWILLSFNGNTGTHSSYWSYIFCLCLYIRQRREETLRWQEAINTRNSWYPLAFCRIQAFLSATRESHDPIWIWIQNLSFFSSLFWEQCCWQAVKICQKLNTSLTWTHINTHTFSLSFFFLWVLVIWQWPSGSFFLHLCQSDPFLPSATSNCSMSQTYVWWQGDKRTIAAPIL